MAITIGTMGVRASTHTLLALGVLSAALGCSAPENRYEIAPTYDAGAGRGHKDDGPSPYLQLCDINRTTCTAGGSVCEEITYTDDEHGTAQSTSVCSAPCTSIDACNQAPAGANKVACVSFGRGDGLCLFQCDDKGACPSGLTCKQDICVRPTR